MSRKNLNPGQGDLFHQPVYPTRVRTDRVDLTGFRSKLSRAMSKALKECPHDRPEIAKRMAVELNQDTFSLSTLNNYTAESNETHDISLIRFKAFVRATGQFWLVDMAFEDDGLTMLVGDEARLAEAALLRQKKREIEDQLKKLEAQPVHIRRSV
jgi:hypothetical protein